MGGDRTAGDAGGCVITSHRSGNGPRAASVVNDATPPRYRTRRSSDHVCFESGRAGGGGPGGEVAGCSGASGGSGYANTAATSPPASATPHATSRPDSLTSSTACAAGPPVAASTNFARTAV